MKEKLNTFKKQLAGEIYIKMVRTFEEEICRYPGEKAQEVDYGRYEER